MAGAGLDEHNGAYFWKGRKEANGGCCLVAWEKVQRPIEFGGLGIHNLETMGWAFQIRWLWLQKTQPAQPWQGLQLPCHAKNKALFNIAISSQVGNGSVGFMFVA